MENLPSLDLSLKGIRIWETKSHGILWESAERKYVEIPKNFIEAGYKIKEKDGRGDFLSRLITLQ